MKAEILTSLREYKAEVLALKRQIASLTTQQVSRKVLRDAAEAIASRWVEEFRSPLEHKYSIEKAVIDKTSESMKKLHVLSRPNNQKSSYTRCLNEILKGFDDKFILPIQQDAEEIHSLPELQKILEELDDPNESEYLTEAVECAQHGFLKAAVVLGWCAAIDRIQKKVLALGFEEFNKASRKIKAQTTGRYKRWNKEFKITTLSDLQTEVFDTDLIVVLVGMELIDGNQAERLETNFQYRNHSAHPGEAPVEAPHVVSFFADINRIILTNPEFSLK